MAFPDNCDPRVLVVDESCGCTLTRANIVGMTPQAFEDQGFKEVGMDRVILNAREARAAGVVENTLEMLLMGAIKPIGKSKLNTVSLPDQGSVILPYIYMRQKRNINSNYFNVNSGAADPVAGTGDVHAGSWQIVVGQSSSTYSTALTSLSSYFLIGRYILVEYVNADGDSVSANFKITNVESVTSTTARLTLEPNQTSASWAGLTADEQAVWQPTAGLAIQLANSVSDYESWCYNDPAENTNKLLTYWMQTTRETHCYNDEYLKALNASLVSGYFRDFRQLTLAEQKRRQAQLARNAWINSVFYGDRITEKQQVETYTQLPTVVDPTNTSCTLEYKANALGFRTILADCNRVFDHQGNPLNLDTLFAVLYDIKRSREADGTNVQVIDIMTDRFTAGKIQEVMNRFYKEKYSTDTTRFYQPGQALKFENLVNFPYDRYQLPPDLGGFDFAVFTHPFFDDKLSAFSTAQKNRGRVIWIIDWSDVKIGLIKSRSVSRKTNELDDIFNCVIQPVVKHYQLQSTTWTAILEDPARHYIIENFSDDCPTITTTGCGI
jgi:hypothetical protein